MGEQVAAIFIKKSLSRNGEAFLFCRYSKFFIQFFPYRSAAVDKPLIVRHVG